MNSLFHMVVGGTIHAHEDRQAASGTYFATGLAVVSFLPAPAAAAAIGVLGFGDPAAGAVGRRWGRTRLAQGRSLEGSLAFVGMGTLAAGGALSLGWPEAPHRWALALAAGCVGALVEVGLRKLDDNLTVPLASGLAATVLARALG
jgi:dolichol kinase